ncbi:MAG: threonine synthase [Beijerinckiaceae bacterium]|nr:threonine synthase [Beijerinckiaceae bacterium]
MRYISTRGEAPALSFADCLLAGLARDGGLYLPETWPSLSAAEIAGYAGQSFDAVAHDVIRRFTGGTIPDPVLRQATREAYATFAHPAVTPLAQIGPNRFVLELFHGPTLAFKDVAMQLLARLMDHALAEAGKRATIVGATSGDTGGAAIEAFRASKRADVFVLFPDGRVSDVQRRMMTTPTEPHLHAITIPGTFDDCQDLVKALFNHHAFRDSVQLSGVNSINWARVVAQVTYYFVAAVALGAPHRKVAFTVPTGNFGDIFAGFVARKMGLPVERLVIATNSNDILARTLETGRYEMAGVAATSSPSMDIQISSNFERLLFEASGRDAAAVRQMMASLKQSGSFALPASVLQAIRADFSAFRADEAEVAAAIRTTRDKAGYVVDPHTATGVVAADKAGLDPTVPMVVLATAAPAKFPETMRNVAGIEAPLPPRLGRLMTDTERMSPVANDSTALEAFIRSHRRDS